MKIEKISKYQNKLLKLKLIQTKTFNKKQYLNNLKIEDIEYRFKKIFYIIYKYHIFNKRILFVGAPFNITFQLKNKLKNTKHIFIAKSIWIRGAINNKKSCFKNFYNNSTIKTNNLSELLLQLKKNIDLIVIFNEQENINIINEGYIARIPIISLNINLISKDQKSNYKVPGDFQFNKKKIRDNFFYFLLVSTLKKKILRHYPKFYKNLNIYKTKKNFRNFKHKHFNKR